MHKNAPVDASDERSLSTIYLLYFIVRGVKVGSHIRNMGCAQKDFFLTN